jgi:hypothetical protein
MDPETFIATLADRVQEQIAAEFHDDERRQYEWENLTAARLLEMLAYMFSQ